MADKQLRKMNRTELIEIIYALQQNERQLQEENDGLRRRLEDKILRMDSAGSIAEAALSLNHVFEDAQAAAQQYLSSLESAAQAESQARQRADEMIRQAQAEVDAAALRIRRTEERCQALREQTDREVRQRQGDFLAAVRETLNKYPDLAAHMKSPIEL